MAIKLPSRFRGNIWISQRDADSFKPPATTPLVICKSCQHKRRWLVAELVKRFGGCRMVQDLWVRWRCSKCGSADCLPCAIEA